VAPPPPLDADIGPGSKNVSPSPRNLDGGGGGRFGVKPSNGNVADRRRVEEEVRERQRLEEERQAAEAAAEAEAEAERQRNRTPDPPPRPATPPPTAMKFSVLCFMWLRDRATAAGKDVLPCTDKKYVVVPAATVEKLFEGTLLMGVVQSYLPRTDEQRTQRGNASLVVSANNVNPQVTYQKPKGHSAVAGAVAPPPPRLPPLAVTSPLPAEEEAALRQQHNSLPSPARASGGNAALHSAVVPRWPLGVYPAMEGRYEMWNAIRLFCKRLGLEMSEDLVHEIADECDTDSLMSFIEGFHQCVKKADLQRREYSKSLVAEAAAPTPTRAAELHKEPPLTHAERVTKKLSRPVVLEPRHAPGEGGRRGTGWTTHGASQPPATTQPTELVTDDAPRTETSGLDNTDQSPEAAVAEAPMPVAPAAAISVSTQTPGRCVVVYDDPTDDPSYQPPTGECMTASAPAPESSAAITANEIAPESESQSAPEAAARPSEERQVETGSVQPVDATPPAQPPTSEAASQPSAADAAVAPQAAPTL
jgi:hypothetical protein